MLEIRDPAFRKAIQLVLEFEGGYCVDQGGPTNYGISSNAYPGMDVKRLTKDKAVVIHFERWIKCKADKMPWPISVMHFDNAVNAGISGAGKMLQRSINEILTGNDKLVVDGKVGPKTLDAIERIRYGGRSGQLIGEYLLERGDHFTKLAALDKHKPSLLGWMRRLMKLREFVKQNPNLVE